MKLAGRIVTGGALLLFGLGTLRVSYAITGCTNAYLTGTYNAQVTNANFMDVLNAINAAASGSSGMKSADSGGFFGGSSGFGSGSGGAGGGFFGGSSGFGSGITSAATGGTTGGTTGGSPSGSSGGTTGATPSVNALQGLGRFFFDGSGNIIGTAASNMSTVIGSYNVNADCSGTAKFGTGQTFNFLVAQQGSQALFLESDSAAAGAVGVLDRSNTACVDPGTPQSFAFSYFGAEPTAASAATFAPASGIGSISIDGQGGFMLREWVVSAGNVKQANVTGTYSVGADCALTLSFNASAGATTGSAANPPAALRGVLVSGTAGLIVVKTDQNAIDMVPGTFVVQ